ncbi:substrate-binding domain-containing protein [Glaciecola sp. KUL10]|uniref:substrate-binding domain-containing protein n=1 Tax=Glaciecola sp. (strain KUL10) TaxID=2161813 RepID=UPI000D78C28A|nr:substrate-binding domain-containing protein [Glaciecola sp. KUL10]GBL03230.1 hypothetical protein KUL10_05120 [Glaciecola sp. KUL10]
MRTIVLVSMLAIALLSTNVRAGVVIIVNKSNALAIDQKTIQRIFLGKEKKFPNGSPVTAINQSPDSAIRSEFDETILGRSSSQVSAYWSKLVFTGKGVPPAELADDKSVIEKVASNPDAIGYIDSNSVTDSVLVIEIK